MKDFIKFFYGYLFFFLFKLIPLKNKVVFSCFSGKKYGDNPKIISNELYIENPEIKQIWLVRNKKNMDMPENIVQVKWGSISMIYHLATAKVWVDSHTKPLWVKKREKQFYINTWHGGLGMKKIEGDVKEKLTERDIKRIKHNSSMIDVLISNSDWLTQIYKRAFWYNGKIEKIGYPKTDYLLKINNEIKKKVYHYFNLNYDDKIFLYTPTMRDNPKKEDFELNAKKIIEALKNKFGGNWKILIKLHPVNEHFIENLKLTDQIIDATNYPDILELTFASEFFVTDYSSGIFDAAILYKKSLIFAHDEEEYTKERGLYIKLEELPFLISRNTNELCDNILNFNYDKYCKEVDAYFSKVGLIKDGHATERIVKMITDFIFYNKRG